MEIIKLYPSVLKNGLRGLHSPRTTTKAIMQEFEAVINALHLAKFKHVTHRSRMGILGIDTLYQGKTVKFHMSPDPSGDGFAGTVTARAPRWRPIGLLVVQHRCIRVLSDYPDVVPTTSIAY